MTQEEIHFENLKKKCLERKIDFKISAEKYFEMMGEYQTRLSWWKEVTKCIDWLYDNDLHACSRGRLRNWMNKSIQFAKDRELRNLSKFAEKPIQKVYKREPLWEPPV